MEGERHLVTRFGRLSTRPKVMGLEATVYSDAVSEQGLFPSVVLLLGLYSLVYCQNVVITQ